MPDPMSQTLTLICRRAQSRGVADATLAAALGLTEAELEAVMCGQLIVTDDMLVTAYRQFGADQTDPKHDAPPGMSEDHDEVYRVGSTGPDNFLSKLDAVRRGTSR